MLPCALRSRCSQAPSQEDIRKTLAYRYSPGGMLDAVADNEGNQTDYLYDPVGRLTGIWAANDDLVSFVRDAGGRLAEKWFVNGTNTRYSYNADNSLAQLTNRSGTGALISQHTYTHDGFGNRDSASDRINAVTRNLTYDYDPLNRLTAVRDADTANSLIEGYSYDPLDRRRTLTAANNSVRVYVHDAANQLNSIQNTTGTVLTSFGYDTNGNLTSKSAGGTTLNLTYDALDRLVQANKTGLPTETYAYDPQGRRIEKTQGGTPTRYRYLGADIYTEYGTDWTQASALYTHGPGADDALIRSNAGGLDEHYQRDGLGSVVSVTDTAGTIQGTARYDAWGNTTQATGNIQRYGYTGREPDATGLIYYRARYYDPEIGRFTQRDPKGFIDGINQYAYAINNPVNFTDPNGTSVISGSQFNSFTQSTSYFSTSIPTGIAASAYYSQISSSSQSLGRSGGSSFLGGLQLGDAIEPVSGISQLAGLVNSGGLFGGSFTGERIQVAATFNTGCRGPLSICGPGGSIGMGPISVGARSGSIGGATTSGQKLLGTPRDVLLRNASDPRLKGVINNLYRPGAKVGSGSTADAVRFERATGKLLSPKGHTQKLIDRRTQLMRLRKDPSLNASDRRIIHDILKDTQGALSK